MNNRNYLPGALVFAVLVHSQAAIGKPPQDAPERKATIYYSAAPWDGAAYAIEIPLEPAEDAPKPVIAVNIWGNPEFLKPKTIHFSGKEDPGGGPNKGVGRASYQSIQNKSWPENLSGNIIFTTLQSGQAVSAAYNLTTAKGKKFKGSFRAIWGNTAGQGNGGRARP